MDSQKKIIGLLNKIKIDSRNNIDRIYINTAKNEFIVTNGQFVIPKIAVKNLDYDISVDIMKIIGNYIPEFLFEHKLLIERKPPSEQHSLHFIKNITGNLINFIHIFKIDFKFNADSGKIIEKGNSDFYPSYQTDRIYYKSRLIPINSISKNNLKIDFDPIRILEANYVESDQYFHTFALFDGLDEKEITRDLHKKLDLDVFNISQELYPFIIYDFFTSCFNVLYPIQDELIQAVEIFEPIFLLIYSRYHNIKNLINIKERSHDSFYIESDSIVLKEEYMVKLKKYFNRFAINRDDELALKGWWEIIID